MTRIVSMLIVIGVIVAAFAPAAYTYVALA